MNTMSHSISSRMISINTRPAVAVWAIEHAHGIEAAFWTGSSTTFWIQVQRVALATHTATPTIKTELLQNFALNPLLEIMRGVSAYVQEASKLVKTDLDARYYYESVMSIPCSAVH